MTEFAVGDKFPLLSEREKWLMDQAWLAAKTSAERYGADHHGSVNGYINCAEWLNDDAADGCTVEMLLAYEVSKR